MTTSRPPLNYRHAYHAGNFADVFKHAVLVALLERLREKPAPLCYVDTHAGRGLYALDGAEANKTGEAADGIGRLLALEHLPASLRAYVEIVRSFNAEGTSRGISRYPGSPCIAGRLLRNQDEAIVCELEAGEARALRLNVGKSGAIHVHQRDGYGALHALLPPAQKRGLVLIDPPFEAREGEFHAIQDALTTAMARWPTGRYAVWYPIKLHASVKPFHRWLRQHYPGKVLIAELLVHPADSALRLNGCGLALVNPPWRFGGTLRGILDALCAHLGDREACQGFVTPPLEPVPDPPHLGKHIVARRSVHP